MVSVDDLKRYWLSSRRKTKQRCCLSVVLCLQQARVRWVHEDSRGGAGCCLRLLMVWRLRCHLGWTLMVCFHLTLRRQKAALVEWAAEVVALKLHVVPIEQ